MLSAHVGAGMAGGCGSCTLCCELLGVKELNKPANTWCLHCKTEQGCGIYEGRPQSCKDFECLWLQSQERERSRMGHNLRPDKARVVLAAMDDGRGIFGHCDPNHPTAWREGGIGALLRHLTEKGRRVVIRSALRFFEIQADGMTREILMSEADENGVISFVRYTSATARPPFEEGPIAST